MNGYKYPVIMTDDILILTINITGVGWVFQCQNTGQKPGFRQKLS